MEEFLQIAIRQLHLVEALAMTTPTGDQSCAGRVSVNQFQGSSSWNSPQLEATYGLGVWISARSFTTCWDLGEWRFTPCSSLLHFSFASIESRGRLEHQFVEPYDSLRFIQFCNGICYDLELKVYLNDLHIFLASAAKKV